MLFPDDFLVRRRGMTALWEGFEKDFERLQFECGFMSL
jgi:hypothetical protein